MPLFRSKRKPIVYGDDGAAIFPEISDDWAYLGDLYHQARGLVGLGLDEEAERESTTLLYEQEDKARKRHQN